MDINSGHPYWRLKDGIPNSYPRLTENIHTSILIIGGGITGALCAWHLIQKGIDCIVIDKGLIAAGSTGAAPGILQYDMGQSLSRLRGELGNEKAHRFFGLSGEAVSRLDEIAADIGFTDLQMRPGLWLASYKKDLPFFKQEFECQKAAGLPVNWLDAADLKAFGIDGHGAIYSSTGGQVNTFGFTHALLKNAVNKGLRVFERTKAAVVNDNAVGLEIKTEDCFAIKAARVICTSANEAMAFIEEKIINLQSTYVLMSEPARSPGDLWPENITIRTSDNPCFYLRSTREGRMLIGGRDEPLSTFKTRNQLLRKKKVQLQNDFRKIFTEKAFEPAFGWTGTFGVTREGLPFIGNYPPRKNIFFAVGFGANSVVGSQVAASLIDKYIRNKKDNSLELFSFVRHRKPFVRHSELQ